MPALALRFRSAHRRPSVRGFTLIELLTVIAIIGILAAILIPTVAKVRQTAKFSTNVSNIRQWTLANTLHMQDWKGFIPWRGDALSSEAVITTDRTHPIGNVKPWYNALPPYLNQKPLKDLAVGDRPRLGDGSIWVSPLADDSVNPTMAWAAFTCYAPSRSSSTYASGRPFVANLYKLKTEPSRTVLFAETPHFTTALRSGVPYPFINEITSPNSVGPYNRNGTSTNTGGLAGKVAIGFFDGSVTTLTGTQIQLHGANVAAEQGNNLERITWRLTED